MIVAKQKEIEEIILSIKDFDRIAVAGCGVCVTVCMSGGEKEAENLTNLLALTFNEKNENQKHEINTEKSKPKTLTTTTPFRQCDMEFLDECEKELENTDCILSMACGAGVQFMAEKFPHKVIIPALNTSFIGVNRDLGYWTEMCQCCGDCVLEKTGGVCPVARCSKSHFNGPCGGSGDGKCEIDKETECGWQLIYERMKRLNQLEKLTKLENIKDWSTGRDGGPRQMRRNDVTI